MRVIALYNIKGGVGKTATAVNLAYLSAHTGYRTLLWDMDPQGAASFYFHVKPKIKGGAQRLVTTDHPLATHLKGTDYPLLDLLPADFSFRHLDLLLNEQKKPKKQLIKLIEPLKEEYDYIFIDCAPSISLTSESVFEAADILLIPTIPTTLSLRTLKQVYRYFKEEGLELNKLRPFFSMVDRRRQMHRLIVDRPPKKPWPFLKNSIPYISEIERMGIERKPASTRLGSQAGIAYRQLWEELIT